MNTKIPVFGLVAATARLADPLRPFSATKLNFSGKGGNYGKISRQCCRVCHVRGKKIGPPSAIAEGGRLGS